MVKQPKNRYNSKGLHCKFVVGIGRSKMRLFDVEQQQPERIDVAQLSKESLKSKFEKKTSIADFSF